MGPGMLPKIRAIIVCSPTAIDLFSIWTLLRVAEVLGIEMRKVRNMLGEKCGLVSQMNELIYLINTNGNATFSKSQSVAQVSLTAVDI